MAQTLDVVKQAMQGIPGLRITSTYRTPERNEAVGGSATSWHMNRSNPAVDVAGPESSMDALASRLASLPYDAELLYKTPNHYDHVHYAIRSDAGIPAEDLPDFPDFGESEVAEFRDYVSPPLRTIDEVLENLEPLQNVAAGQPDIQPYGDGTQYMRVKPKEGIKTVGQQGGRQLPPVDVGRVRMSASDRLRSRPVVGRMD